ncbi:hypothetical protein SDC9_144587 [bioreactor metagenome]|uniref:Uncharacterized protein n=1 Tax=bioreactor metagenome TaxID=1076179 RepID=A0A645E6G1_9ZZZZ
MVMFDSPLTTRGRLESVKGQIGVMMSVERSTSRMGPPAAKLYPVEPVGVATMMPSERKKPASVSPMRKAMLMTLLMPLEETTISLRAWA